MYQTHDRRVRAGGRSDPLSDDWINTLSRDVLLFRELGLNAIYVYSVDNTVSHDAAMKLLADAGIYVVVGLSTPHMAINRAAPYRAYTTSLLEHYFRTVDCFDKYTNTLGVFAANTVINGPESTPAAEIVRAVVRDVKKYISLKASVSNARLLPVGVTNADVNTIQYDLLQYFTAGGKEERVDFYGTTNYSWCNKSSMQMSGWNRLVQTFAKVPIPCFLAEYGTKIITPRILEEVAALYSLEMTSIFSGGFLYEFYNGVNQYGIVKPGSELEKLPEFETFNKQMNSNIPEKDNNKFTREARARIEQDDPAWVGTFPQVTATWKAWSKIPLCPIDWDALSEKVKDDEWTVLDERDLASAMERVTLGTANTSDVTLPQE